MLKIDYWILIVISLTLFSANAEQLPLQHGIPVSDEINVAEYWVSEKLDGMRAFWDGKQLLSRQGNIINTPANFTSGWPTFALDGELWSHRGEFEQLMSCIKRHQLGPCWQDIKFMLFDLPQHPDTFSNRVQAMNRLITNNSSPYLQMIPQVRIPNKQALYQKLDNIIAIGGEGLMLHHQNAIYQPGRNKALMKLKPYQDSEAIVVAHLPGKGKYKNMLGSLLVETPQGLQFKVGTGFTDQQRKTPPPIGAIITYKYIGKTARGVPRFASFIRIRHQL
ncbi:ATP-dependent DNA ligase [Thalassotalea insulae]|uniref:ATP-dependent DNA ligase n=2 Tax=Thalassotalea insulae TaxID=2056778 RepID=A0ABQ6GT30_9GAMM|nr:ATP-dependent DNA ligase [Thalassotalea insulae]